MTGTMTLPQRVERARFEVVDELPDSVRAVIKRVLYVPESMQEREALGLGLGSPAKISKLTTGVRAAVRDMASRYAGHWVRLAHEALWEARWRLRLHAVLVPALAELQS